MAKRTNDFLSFYLGRFSGYQKRFYPLAWRLGMSRCREGRKAKPALCHSDPFGQKKTLWVSCETGVIVLAQEGEINFSSGTFRSMERPRVPSIKDSVQGKRLAIPRIGERLRCVRPTWTGKATFHQHSLTISASVTNFTPWFC